MVPFGFSFGDFVAGISLVKSLINALDESGGAQAEYRGLIAELYCLERALVAIKEIEVQSESREYDATQQAVRGCRECIDRFILKIASYQSLTAGTSSVKDQIRKITWARCRKEDLQRFKEDLGVYVSATGLLLNTLQLSYAKRTTLTTSASIDAQAHKLREIENTVKNSDDSHREILLRIERLLGDREAAQTLDNASPSFLVRPLRLIEAPIAPNFITRIQILHEMEDHLLPLSSDRQKILVLSGPGGIGKSQMARHYAVQHRETYDSLFWTSGKSEQSLRLSIARIAELIPLPRFLDTNQKLLKNEGDIERAMLAVNSWFTSAGNTRWLVIVDNVDNYVEQDDDEEVLQAAGGYDVARYLPSVAHGTVIITSRLSFLARSLGAQNLGIGEMTLEEGLQVLHKASGRPFREEGAVELVHKFGGYPLSLMQAANYIFEKHTTTKTYIERYDSNKKLLMEQPAPRREYSGRSIDVALRLSLQAVESRKPEAVALLLLCGFLDNRDIFWGFINQAFKVADTNTRDLEIEKYFDDPSSSLARGLRKGWLDDIANDEATFDEVVKHLCEFSFVRWNEESTGFSIHSIIHEWLVLYVGSQTRVQLLRLASSVVAANYGSISEIPAQRIQPHADRCVCLGTPNQEFQTWGFASLFLLGAFYYDNLELTLARRLISRAMEKLVATFGDRSLMTALWGMRVVPMFMEFQQSDEVIRKLQIAQTIMTSPPVIPVRVRQNRIDVGNHLCYVYQMQGDFAKAVEVGEGSMELAASGHVSLIYTCCATGLLAESYLALRKYANAKSLASIAIKQHETYFGTDCNDGSISAWRRRNETIMAVACAYQGDFELAEVILVSVHADAVRYNGQEGTLSEHAQQNLDLLREAKKIRQNSPSASYSPSASCSASDIKMDQEHANRDDNMTNCLQKLSTDRDITYLRFDLAQGLFDTLGLVNHRIRTVATTDPPDTLGFSSGNNNLTSFTAASVMPACVVQ